MVVAARRHTDGCGCVAAQGLVVETVARVPYLCRGDYRHPFYVLYDAILVCKCTDDDERSSSFDGDIDGTDAGFRRK